MDPSVEDVFVGAAVSPSTLRTAVFVATGVAVEDAGVAVGVRGVDVAMGATLVGDEVAVAVRVAVPVGVDVGVDVLLGDAVAVDCETALRRSG